MKENNVIYKIFLLCNGEQKDYIGWYRTSSDAMHKFKSMLEESKKVKVPIKFINTTERTNGKKKTYIKEVKYEIAIVKKKEEGESDIVKLKNEYGIYTDHTTTSDNWVLFEKEIYNMEERFWVYGHNPLKQRKTAEEIFNEILEDKCKKRLEMVNIKLYRNKILFETYDSLDFITCKNKTSAIALYNALESMCTEAKAKYVLFSGDWSNGDRARICEEKLLDLTNWTLKKIRRSSTRP